jgi:phosphohistidine phosphatase SixA
MKIYLIHHANVLPKEQDPERHLSEQGRLESDVLGAKFASAGVAPVRILHSDRPFVKETADRIAAAMGAEDKTVMSDYPITNEEPIEPFLAEIAATSGDIMMVGHSEFLIRSASKLLCGDETCRAIEFKPGNCTAFCLEETGDNWAVAYAWRHEHLAA